MLRRGLHALLHHPYPLSGCTIVLVFGVWTCHYVTFAVTKEMALSTYILELSYCEKIHIGETVFPFKVRLKAHSNTIIYRPCPTPVENFNRAFPSPQTGSPKPGGIPPVICQQQLASVTLHLGPVLSALQQAHPLR